MSFRHDFDWEGFSPPKVIKVMVSDMRVIPPVCKAWAESIIKHLESNMDESAYVDVIHDLTDFIEDMKRIEKTMVVVIRYVQALEDGQVEPNALISDHVPDIPVYPDGGFDLTIAINSLKNTPLILILYSMIQIVDKHLIEADSRLNTLFQNPKAANTSVGRADKGRKLFDILNFLKSDLASLSEFTSAGLKYYEAYTQS